MKGLVETLMVGAAVQSTRDGKGSASIDRFMSLGLGLLHLVLHIACALGKFVNTRLGLTFVVAMDGVALIRD